jgi:hypothetical protein
MLLIDAPAPWESDETFQAFIQRWTQGKDKDLPEVRGAVQEARDLLRLKQAFRQKPHKVGL